MTKKHATKKAKPRKRARPRKKLPTLPKRRRLHFYGDLCASLFGLGYAIGLLHTPPRKAHATDTWRSFNEIAQDVQESLNRSAAVAMGASKFLVDQLSEVVCHRMAITIQHAQNASDPFSSKRVRETVVDLGLQLQLKFKQSSGFSKEGHWFLAGHLCAQYEAKAGSNIAPHPAGISSSLQEILALEGISKARSKALCQNAATEITKRIIGRNKKNPLGSLAEPVIDALLQTSPAFWLPNLPVGPVVCGVSVSQAEYDVLKAIRRASNFAKVSLSTQTLRTQSKIESAPRILTGLRRDPILGRFLNPHGPVHWTDLSTPMPPP
ncbi:MAG: hypothetical protein M5U26_22410 [Planctomycetota bacterium]|nr:hypothetical protein [Planctomycetota bacterium]